MEEDRLEVKSNALIYMTEQQMYRENIKIIQIKEKHVQEVSIASIFKVVSNWKTYELINLEYIHEYGVFIR